MSNTQFYGPGVARFYDLENDVLKAGGVVKKMLGRADGGNIDDYLATIVEQFAPYAPLDQLAISQLAVNFHASVAAGIRESMKEMEQWAQKQIAAMTQVLLEVVTPFYNDMLIEEFAARGIKLTVNTPLKCSLGRVMNCDYAQRWLQKNLTSGVIEVQTVSVESVCMFGANPGYIVFTLGNDKNFPGYSVTRGGTGCCFVVIRDEHGKPHGLFALQYRVPVGQLTTEAPAGVKNVNELAKNAVFRELEEEFGRTITFDHFEQAHPLPIFLSPGGSSEEMEFFVGMVRMTQEEIGQFHGTVGGVPEEFEVTEVQIIPILPGLCYQLNDGKTLIGFFLALMAGLLTIEEVAGIADFARWAEVRKLW